MNAEEAKKQAQTHKEQIEENKQVRKNKAHDDNVENLYNHFQSHVLENVKKGRLSTEVISFPNDRYTDDVIREVNDRLRADGYHLHKEVHNAFNTVKFTLSWN